MCPCLRLVKGDGEIVEEIVSREQQKAINKVSLLNTVQRVSSVRENFHFFRSPIDRKNITHEMYVLRLDLICQQFSERKFNPQNSVACMVVK